MTLELFSSVYAQKIDELYVKNKEGQKFYLGMDVSELSKSLGQMTSKTNVWKEEAEAFQPLFQSEVETDGISVKYMYKTVCEMFIQNPNFFINESQIGINSSLAEIYKIFGEKKFSIESHFDKDLNNHKVTNKILTYEYDTDIKTFLIFNINPETDLCTSYELLFSSGEISIIDKKGQEFYLDMPVEKAKSFLGKPDSLHDLWKEYGIPGKSYFEINYHNLSFLYYHDSAIKNSKDRIDQIIFNSEEYKIKELVVGCGTSLERIYEIFGKSPLSENIELNNKTKKEV